MYNISDNTGNEVSAMINMMCKCDPESICYCVDCLICGDVIGAAAFALWAIK